MKWILCASLCCFQIQISPRLHWAPLPLQIIPHMVQRHSFRWTTINLPAGPQGWYMNMFCEPNGLPTSSDSWSRLHQAAIGLQTTLPDPVPFLYRNWARWCFDTCYQVDREFGVQLPIVSAGGWHQQLLARIESKDQAVLSDRQGSFVLGCC